MVTKKKKYQNFNKTYICMGGIGLEGVTEIRYLGSMLENNENCTPEFKRRITLSKKYFQKEKSPN